MYQYLYINSDSKSSGNNNDFKINLNKYYYAKHINLINCQIPNVFYNITQNNNNILVGGITNYNLQPGSYNFTELLSALNTLLLGAATFSFDSISQKITITSAESIDFRNSNNMAAILGFESKLYEDAAFYVGAISPEIYPLHIFINLNLGKNIYTGNNILSCNFIVPINGNKNDITNFNENTNYTLNNYVTKEGFNFLEIKVLDRSGKLIENMPNWNMIIKLTY